VYTGNKWVYTKAPQVLPSAAQHDRAQSTKLPCQQDGVTTPYCNQEGTVLLGMGRD